MESERTGKPVANQFVMVESGEGWNGNFLKKETFQSYQSTIATAITWKDGSTEITLDPVYWDYSKTTREYLYKFLASYFNGISLRKEVLHEIKEGNIKLENLNK